MGEIADMMLEGILCATCGVALDDVADPDFEEPGHPRYCCEECAPEGGVIAGAEGWEE